MEATHWLHNNKLNNKLNFLVGIYNIMLVLILDWPTFPVVQLLVSGVSQLIFSLFIFSFPDIDLPMSMSGK